MAAVSYNSWLIATLAGMILGMLTVASHNFFHLRDTFRRWYWDVSMFNSTEWRITHVLSHHVHTNTVK